MKISIFKNKTYVVGIDYSKRPDCKGVFEITESDLEILEKGGEFKIIKGKLIIEKTPEVIEKEKQEEIQKINKEFENTIKQITAGYTQAEIDTWSAKVEEAKKVIAGETSNLLSSLLIEGENLLDFSKNILKKAKEYSQIYYEAEKTKREKIKNIT